MATEYASQASSGHGATFAVGDGTSPETFTDVVEIKEMTPGAWSTSDVDTTHLLSPNNHKERIPGQRDSAAWQFKANWRPTDATQSNDDSPGGILFLHRTRAIRHFKVTVPGFGSPALEINITGYVSNASIQTISNNSAMELNFEIQPSTDRSAELP